MKLAGWLLVALVMGCGVASAKSAKAGRSAERWETVQGLVPGTEINVFSENQARPDLCFVSTADDSELTCLVEDAARDVRLVFPRSKVRAVWVFEPAPNRHVGLWIALGVTAALEIAACVIGGAPGCLAMGAVMAGIWAAAVTPSPWSIWMPPPPPRPQRMRRRLVYQMPPMAVAPLPVATP